MNRRIVTEMVDMKLGINSMKKKLSSNHNGSAKTGPKGVSKRRNSMPISTEEVLHIPFPQAGCTNKSSKEGKPSNNKKCTRNAACGPTQPEVPISPYRKNQRRAIKIGIDNGKPFKWNIKSLE